MKTAYIQLVRHMAIMGHSMRVYSDGELMLPSTMNTREVIKTVKDLEQALIVFTNTYTGSTSSALVSAYGLMPYETIIDSSLNIDDLTNAIAQQCEPKGL